MICSLGFIPTHTYAQNWHTAFSLDTRTGYTTNTYLNPIVSEWDRSVDTGYLLALPVGQLSYTVNNLSGNLSGGAVYNSFFDERKSWTGGFSTAGIRYLLTNSFSATVDGGGSYFSTMYDRSLFWVQPGFNWSFTTFSQLRVKAGPAYRQLSGILIDGDQDYQRFNSYSAEIQHWRNFQWQFRGTVYGNLEDITGNIGFRGSAEYWRSRNWQLSFRAGLEQFRYEMMLDGGGNGGPPIGVPGVDGNKVSDEADRIFRTGIGAIYRLNSGIAFNVNADYLNYFSTAVDESLNDFHISAGLQFSFSKPLGRSSGATTEWKQNDKQVVLLKLNYSGDGQLYILGDFNDWEQPGIPLTRQKKNRFAVELSLDSGSHEYKILLKEGDEEKWIDFSDDAYTISDGFGGENGLIFID